MAAENETSGMNANLRFLALVGLPVLLALANLPQEEQVLVNVAPPAMGTRITADTEYSDAVSAANVADGRMDHGYACWFSRDWTKLPCSLTFELRQKEHIRRVVLYQAIWSGSMYHTKDYAIEVSEDGQAWVRVAEGTLPDENAARREHALDVETRWLRVVVLTSYIPFQTCGFAEVQLFAERPVAVGSPTLLMNGEAPVVSREFGGRTFAWRDGGPQSLINASAGEVVADLKAGEVLTIRVPVQRLASLRATVPAELLDGTDAHLTMTWGSATAEMRLDRAGQYAQAELELDGARTALLDIALTTSDRALVRLGGLRLATGETDWTVALALPPTDYGSGPPPVTPPMRPGIERAMIEADWQAQDGLGTPRLPVSYATAISRVVARGDRLVERREISTGLRDTWQSVRREWEGLRERTDPDDDALRKLYLRMRWAKRALLLELARPHLAPVVFAKQVPPCFSHQLTQYYGRYARPGGGIFLLTRPGVTMETRDLTGGGLPLGSAMFPEVSWDADRIYFAFCEAPTTPEDTIQGHRGRYYHLYSMRPDGSGLRRLTDGPYDDFAPRVLPDGRIVFISTRRGGWHRCGTPGCENYVLTVAEADGRNPVPISFHETQEWDPAVLHDGRIVYTRWDYVDRHAVFYEHLWTTAPDGTRTAALFGNKTLNPVGIWEPRPVPGSRRVMATAAAHHAMTAGSIILLDPAAGTDGPAPITRLTPDVPFPESETPVAPSWYAPTPGVEPVETEENRRWPGHCYRSPYPLTERLFLAAYSFERLIGEPRGNPANMFGIYLCDADGNRELLYRDPSIASVWPVPLKRRPRPPVLPSVRDPRLGDNGVLVLQNVYASLPQVPPGSIKELRVVQVLPKSTPGKDMPPVGAPSGAPGKQVLGTVPVEPDGSAHFVVPARKELSFQALDSRGMAVQIMRSGVYLQPGERLTCVGCHEPRTTAPPRGMSAAQRRPPSRLRPGPDGSKPFSYPILVQPILNQRCVGCHSGAKPAAGVDLTDRPEGPYTASYNALVRYVPYSDMGNAEPLSRPDRYGARASPLMRKLLEGHQGVRLTAEEIRRLATWMDTSALFYGTFDPADQERQRRGERIKGPALE